MEVFGSLVLFLAFLGFEGELGVEEMIEVGNTWVAVAVAGGIPRGPYQTRRNVVSFNVLNSLELNSNIGYRLEHKMQKTIDIKGEERNAGIEEDSTYCGCVLQLQKH
ncbi:hypothetical protein Droror1_Dr00013960 [Drosera rotundifolia]